MRPAATVDALRALGARTVVETTHRAHVVVADATGRVLLAAGDATRETPLRSCAKPFQALALFSSGAMARDAASDEELALACASHEADARHVTFVAGWLARLGLDPSALACGAHPPGDPEAQAALTRAGLAPTPLHNNCSGKHTGMLATALALGAPTRDYLKLAHPVQREIVKVLSLLLTRDGAPPPQLAFGVDGCSAPTAVLPLGDLARLGALLVTPGAVPDPALAGGLERLAAAMTRHADLVGGRGVLDTLLMRSVAGLVAKRGADGVQLIALARAPRLDDRPVGVAIKVEDGSAEARAAITLATLDALGVLSPAARTALAEPLAARRKNHRGLVVGRWAVDLALEPPAP